MCVKVIHFASVSVSVMYMCVNVIPHIYMTDTETEAKWITLTHIYMTDTEREAKWITLTHIYMTDTETEGHVYVCQGYPFCLCFCVSHVYVCQCYPFCLCFCVRVIHFASVSVSVMYIHDRHRNRGKMDNLDTHIHD
jgi:hypothetical protein